MKVDKNTLRKIAHLARLELNKERESEMIESLTEILTWVEHLEEVDTEGIEPLTTMSKEVNVLRDDVGENKMNRIDALKNTPDSDEKYFKVPKVKD